MLLDRRLLMTQYGLCKFECTIGAIASVRRAAAADIMRVLAVPNSQCLIQLFCIDNHHPAVLRGEQDPLPPSLLNLLSFQACGSAHFAPGTCA
jgi:hypothetical protein